MNEAIAPIERTEVVMKIVWKHFTEKQLNQINLSYVSVVCRL